MGMDIMTQVYLNYDTSFEILNSKKLFFSLENKCLRYFWESYRYLCARFMGASILICLIWAKPFSYDYLNSFFEELSST